MVVNQREHLANIAGGCAPQVGQNRAAVRLVEKTSVCVAGEALVKIGRQVETDALAESPS